MVTNYILDELPMDNWGEGLEEIIFETTKFFKGVLFPFHRKAQQKGIKFLYCEGINLPEELIGYPNFLQQLIIYLLEEILESTEKKGICFSVDVVEEHKNSVDIEIIIEEISTNMPSKSWKNSSYNNDKITDVDLIDVEKVLEKMEGQCFIGSKENGDRYVTLKFNLLTKNTEMKLTENIDGKDSNPSSYKILLVEDDLINQKIIEHFILANGWDITIASCGEKALEYLEGNNFDVILMDIDMPGMDGYETTSKILEKEKLMEKRTPIIALTATLLEREKNKCMEAGMQGFINKPVYADKLFEMIERVCEGREIDVYEIDLAITLSRLSNQKSILKNLIRDFTSTDYEEKTLGEVKRAIDGREKRRAKKALHKLKGTIYYFHIYPSIDPIVSSLAEKLEEEELEEAKELYKGLQKVYDNIKEILLQKRL